MTFLTKALTAASLLVLSAGAAAATPAIGLSGDKTLVMIDSATGKVGGSMDVSGVDKLLGIDQRPATGQLIGVTADHRIVEINPKTGEATAISTMDKMLPIEDGNPVIVDFNPKANKLRFMTGTTNHRVDIESGKVTVDGSLSFEAKDMHAGEAPNIVAAAYINSFGKPASTAMYDIDATINAVIQQTSPNDGTLAAIGKLGIAKPQTYAFDIATNADGENQAWLAAGTELYTVSLENGGVTGKWTLEGLETPLRDITFMTAN
ncbi:uncharacterized protein DUF4394 [Roseibium hamelinense]|uniref:Uncharacterized protein DUF4394 n=1 Tax=Roseibium hamelinense TaxID=150831 RepID=A0A562T1C6_9HYPH|nr:DUF4394 domain-containing protein [Roseibium hamelinense]MTI44464.1 DUF4394 domain-containing protein [Roseibium hamelinense]TWI87431.1 uncharacterized protein DUF4394 [Roseibium hamelinense]